jgi:diketogulonate reductase-like aldo/keto reductase
MPLLGFGVYQNYSAKSSVLDAFKAGYRYFVIHFVRSARIIHNMFVSVWIRRHVDSAQLYRNEADVGAAAKECGIDRGDLFISQFLNGGHLICSDFHIVAKRQNVSARHMVMNVLSVASTSH